MKAVIRAILLDAEARGTTSAAASPGKVKEPALLSLAIGRLIADKTDGYAFITRDAAMGEQPFRAPSVFNFYPPDYPLPLGGTLLSPPSKLMTTATITARHNLAYDWTVSGDVATRTEYAVQATIAGGDRHHAGLVGVGGVRHQQRRADRSAQPADAGRRDDERAARRAPLGGERGHQCGPHHAGAQARAGRALYSRLLPPIPKRSVIAMTMTRRDFVRTAATAATVAAAGLQGRAVRAAANGPYRAMVGVFLFGGSDNWNMIVPTDTRYAAYAASRGATLALPQASLAALPGVPFGLHPSLAPLTTAWNEGALNAVLNVGSLYQPLTKALYQSNSSLRPLALMSHADEQNHWQGNRVRDINSDGFMGRINDRESALAVPDLISLGGSTLALIGRSSSPLVLPSNGTLVRNGYNASATDAAVTARQAATSAFASAADAGTVTQVTGQAVSGAYAQGATANAVIAATSSTVDQYFRNPTTGVALASDISRQLLRIARMIEARGTLGHARQTFFASHGGYDTHSAQVDATATTTGLQANLFNDLALALAGFYAAMKALGLQENVTAFTMSDFGRTYKVNAQRGTDHAWGNNHLVIGGAVRDQTIHGGYPDVTLGGAQDIDTTGLGRWIPTLATEEYLGAIALWYGVAPTDMPYVFPNWSTWSTGGRGPITLFG